MSRPTYRVTAQRDGRWWFVRVPEIQGAITQARRLEQVEAMAREVISLLLDVTPDSFDLDVQPAIPDEVRAELTRARDLQRQAERTQAEAATLVREAARKLRAQGLTVADVGAVLGVSFQRASQLLDQRAS
ncbi:MAG TPA: type II toxin-antitoxin system HicB family antitoxin [Actinomycetota bacterium]|nr:type II toxin-antitoxin system HicB family antitoxin [Actinomycetota bacterium]